MAQRKGGMASGLSAGVLFSPRQEATQLDAARTKLLLDMAGLCSEIYGLEMNIIKQPNKVFEFHFRYNNRAARRSIERDAVVNLGPMTAVGRMFEDVCADLGADFSWDKMPKADDPEAVYRPDEAGEPQDVQDRTTRRPRAQGDSEIRKHPAGFASNWSIPELKEWAGNNGHPVPSTLMRKGDILEWMFAEFDEVKPEAVDVDPDGG